MSPLEAILLGALQGATEFLPISSSGHLRLAEAALDAEPATLLFDIALHVGTLVAVVAFFRRDIARIVAGLDPRTAMPWRQRPALRAVALLMLASLFTAVIGLALEPTVAGQVAPGLVGGLLLVNGGILLSTRATQRRRSSEPDDRWPHAGITAGIAIAIGIAQGIAVLPGISRSGTTIATAMLLGVSWRPAATFSFLLSIPAILGALVLKLDEASALGGSAEWAILGLAVATALAVGLLCLALLVRTLRKARFHLFAWYCFALGLAAVIGSAVA